jgi:hypothetical protein
MGPTYALYIDITKKKFNANDPYNQTVNIRLLI